MVKYINSDKLKELIDEKWKELANNDLKVGGHKWDPEINTYLSVLKLVDSLQQDQLNNNLEEKAEAYDKAIKRAKAAIDVAADKDLVKGVAITILPELCESEDEKIRMALISLIKEIKSQPLVRLEPWDEYIAYLEKQKEQEIDVKDYRLRDTWEYIDEFIKKFKRVPKDIDELSACVDYVINHKSIDEKEQKSTDEQFPPLEGLDAIKAKYYGDGFKNGFDEGVDSIKPAKWSKEDEKYKQAIIDAIQIVMEECGDAESIEKYKDDIDWLENRSGTLRPQAHMVSVEGAKKFGNREYERGVKDGIQSEKSHQWKPSEQEKIALRTAICILTEENCPKTVANLQAILDVFDDKESRKD